jgi:CheY-like chemotaxis protein
MNFGRLEVLEMRAEKPTILCIDDDKTGVNLRKAVLQSAGYSVLMATSGREAIEIIESEPRIDLVIVDYVMPGMDGTMVAAAIRTSRPKIPIVMLTAYVAVPENTQNWVDHIMRKGQEPAVFLREVGKLLEQQRPAA